MTELDPEKLVGRRRHATAVVSAAEVERYRATLSPFLVEGTPDVAPLGFHWCIAPVAARMVDLRADGATPDLAEPLPEGLPNRVWAGGRLSFVRPIPIGSEVRRTDRIDTVQVKSGRVGPVVFLTTHVTFDIEGGTAIDEWRTVALFRRPPLANSREPDPERPGLSGVPDAAVFRASVTFDPVLLFRYSALTFNAHRIHYDRRFCTEAEGIDGLAVQGPLQATLLLNAMALADSAPLRHAQYRHRAMLTDGGPSSIAVHRDGEGILSASIHDAADRETTSATTAM